MASSSSSRQETVEYQHQQSRSIASTKLYDAFITHRGPDVKDTLAKQLYDLLKARQCRAFLDREEIEGGDTISSEISNGIRSSVVQIAIFSKGYAGSKWCLNELVDMLKQTDALFIPVFYDVEPMELRCTERGAYAEVFSYYQSEKKYLDKVDEWKKALLDAADRSGYELKQHNDNLCEKIVSRVLQEMNKRIPLHVAKYPVGLAKIVQHFERSCSEIARDKVTIAGISGLGGSGKTTLAKELFNRKHPAYDASCFLFDVRESHARRDLPSLQSQIFKDLFNEENRVFSSVDVEIGALEHRLERARHRHFLIVLDDIDHQDQLDALLPEAMLSCGSMVIITTRDKSMLKDADIRYKMKGLNRDLAKDLFCSHAFRGRVVPSAYEKLVERFVEFCGGLPLSLKVLGAHVSGRAKYYWELELDKVKNIPPKDIIQSLKISFDGLERHEKQIFIDIACFLNKTNKFDLEGGAKSEFDLEWGTKSDFVLEWGAKSVWNASGWSAELAVETLKDKCLLETRRDEFLWHFEMHDHLRDLGRHMAQDLGPPRLWKPELLRSMEAKGFKQILAETKGRCFHQFYDSSLNTTITYFIGSINDSAETELLWLKIDGPVNQLESIPSWIPLQKLLYLYVCNVGDLCSAFQQQMKTNPQVSFELRELVISGPCDKTDMTSFLQLLQQLNNLRSLSLFSCSLNENFNLSSRSLETTDFNFLRSIYELVFSGEMCPRLRSLTMSDLNGLELQELERLNTLQVRNCPQLETISGLRCLEHIAITQCDQLQRIGGVEELQGLKSLEIVVPEGDPSLYNCINGLRRLPSEYTILAGKGERSRLNANLFCEVNGAPAVTEIERGVYDLEMRSSSSAITIYALHVSSTGYFEILTPTFNHVSSNYQEWMVTGLLTEHNSNVSLKYLKIEKGLMVTVNKNEEEKALNILQIIVNRLYSSVTRNATGAQR